MQIVLEGGKFDGAMIIDYFFLAERLGQATAAYPDDILNSDIFQGFWIRSSGHKTEVGRENEVQKVSLTFTLQLQNILIHFC